MYKLFYYPSNASLAPHLVLKELGVEFELELVDRKIDEHKSKEYLVLNPTGRMPTFPNLARCLKGLASMASSQQVCAIEATNLEMYQ